MLACIVAVVLRKRKRRSCNDFQNGSHVVVELPDPKDSVHRNSKFLLDRNVYAQEVHSIIERVREELMGVRYNKEMLRFLYDWMKQIEWVGEYPSKMPSKMQPYWQNLKNVLVSGERLVKRHATCFELQNFYTIDEARYLVETLCINLQDSVRPFARPGSSTVEVRIPETDVCKDRNFLELCLGFFLGKYDLELDDSFEQEWHSARNAHRSKLHCIDVIKRSDITWEGSEVIGRGAFSTVSRATWKNKKVAVKELVLEEDHNRNQQLAAFHAEASVHASVVHDHIARVFAMCNSGVLVLELGNENLKEWLEKRRWLHWELKLRVLYQAASGLCHLHSMGLVHRDVKSRNFLVFYCSPHELPTIKLCDFGLAMGQSEEWRELAMQTTVRMQPGTFLYFAPELHAGKAHSYASDVFSFGMVMCEVTAQSHLYGGKAEYSVMEMKRNGLLPCHFPLDCPAELKLLITRCLSVEPEKRPCMQEVVGVLEHMQGCEVGRCS